MPNTGKYGGLLDDKDVRRWHDNLAANSPITAEVYLRTLGLYCDLAHTSPKQILKDGPTKRFRDDFADFVREMESKGKAGSYIIRFKKAGFKKDEVEKMNLEKMTDEDLQSTVRQRLVGMMTGNGSRQKVVPIQDVRSFIGQGYEYVASLPDGGAIVKIPF